MSETYQVENNAIDGENEMGSLNHSTVQANLAFLLKLSKKFAVMIKLGDLQKRKYQYFKWGE